MEEAWHVPIPEYALRELGRSMRSILMPNDVPSTNMERISRLHGLLTTLLETAHSISISVHHRVIACNTLCGFLDLCLEKNEESILSAIYAENIWKKLFDIYLSRYDRCKPKSMKQVLSTLAKLLSNGSQTALSASAKAQLIQTLNSIIFLGDEPTKLKGAIQSLNYFLSKDIISLNGCLESCKDTQDQNANLVFLRENDSLLVRFLANVLELVTHNDVAGAVGHLFETILKRLECAVIEEGDDTSQIEDTPKWAQAVVCSLQKHPKNLHSFQSHVFPLLFRARFLEFTRFLKYLRIDLILDQSHRSEDTCTHESLILFSALRAGNNVGLTRLVDGKFSKTVSFTQNEILLPDSTIGSYLGHATEDIRIASLSLLIQSFHTTRPFTRMTLSLLKTALPQLYSEADASIRSEVNSLVQNLIARLRSITASLSHKAGSQLVNMTNGDIVLNKEVEDPVDLLNVHEDFVSWFVNFLVAEFNPSASYQRHITALKSFEEIVKSGLDSTIPRKYLSKQANAETKWPFHQNLVEKGLRGLCDLLLDPFEDVRLTAASILRIKLDTVPRQKLSLHNTELTRMLARAVKVMCITGRMDHADGMARICALKGVIYVRNTRIETEPWSANIARPFEGFNMMDELLRGVEEAVCIAKINIITAVANFHMHGYLISLRYLLEDREFMDQMVQEDEETLGDALARMRVLVVQIWDCVRNHLCNDAPEGRMPEDVEEEGDISTKDVLSYTWRALKESSLLLRSIVSMKMNYTNSTLQLKSEDFKILGDLCFTQLAQLRHRGAFSTVSQTFVAICRRCSVSEDISIRQRIVEWYKEVLTLIKSNGTVTTRRSAGIPALMVALLSAEHSEPFFEEAMLELQRISKEPTTSRCENTDLPQVHALNSLRSIFTSAGLAEYSEKYIAPCLNIAITCSGLDIWAIRNCGLMLFRSLIDRLLGTTNILDSSIPSARVQVKFSYENFPELVDFILETLRTHAAFADLSKPGIDIPNNDIISPEAIFPVLDLFLRAPMPKPFQTDVKPLLIRLSSCPQWAIRDMTARAFASVAQLGDILPLVTRAAGIRVGQNRIHGLLLCIKHVVNSHTQVPKICHTCRSTRNDSIGISPTVSAVLVQLFGLLNEAYEPLFKDNPCPMTKATYVDILNILGLRALIEHRNDNLSSNDTYTIQKRTDVFDSHEIANSLFSEIFTAMAFEKQIDDIAKSALLYQSMAFNMLLKILISKFSGRIVDGRAYSIPPEHLTVDALGYRQSDAEPIISALEMLHDYSSQEGLFLHEPLTAICRDLWNEKFPEAVQLKAQDILAGLLPKQLELTTISPERCQINTKLTNSDFVADFDMCADPSSFNVRLRMWGCAIHAKRADHGFWTDELCVESALWIRMTEICLNDLNDVSLRYAAVNSLGALRYLWLGESKYLKIVEISYLLVIYGSLTDDDDEIRALAAYTASRHISYQSKSHTQQLSSMAALQVLVSMLREEVSQSPGSGMLALSRLCNYEIGKESQPKNPHESLNKMCEENTALFVVEKQNLFIDEVQDARNLTHMLMKSPKLSNEILITYNTWVLNGLKALIECARTEPDGPLGWTSKCEVYIYGLRIILAAGVALHWNEKILGLAHLQRDQILMQLNELLEAGVRSDLHDDWLRTIRNQVVKIPPCTLA